MDINMDIEKKLKKIEKRLSKLELGKKGKTRKWYREVSNIASIAAVVIALATLLFQYKEEVDENYGSSLNNFRYMIQRLGEIDAQLNYLNNVEPANGEEKLRLSREIQTWNSEKFDKIKSVTNIIPQIKRSIRPADYYLLATSLAQSGKFELVENYFLKGLEKKQPNSERVIGFRGYGRFLYIDSKFNDINKADQYFEKALALFSQSSEVEAKMNDITTLMVWTEAKGYSGDIDGAQSKFNMLLELWSKLPNNLKVSNRRMMSQFRSVAEFHKLVLEEGKL